MRVFIYVQRFLFGGGNEVRYEAVFFVDLRMMSRRIQ